MTALDDIADEVRYLAIALGVVRTVDGTPTLNSDFFTAPSASIRSLLSDDEQRTGLLDALAILLPETSQAGADGLSRKCFALLDPTGAGQISLYVTIPADPSASAAFDVGIIAELSARTTPAPRLSLELPLLTVDNGTLRSIFDDPTASSMQLSLDLPLDANGGVAQASLAFGGAAKTGAFQIRVTTVEVAGGEPNTVVLDPATGLSDTGPLVGALIDVLVSHIPSPPAALQALPTLLGLRDLVPVLPLTELSRDATAARRWLAALAADPTDAAAPLPLVTWLGGLAELVGSTLSADASTAALDPRLGTVAIEVLPAGPTTVGVSVTVALVRAPDSAVRTLTIGCRVEIPTTGIDARFVVDAEILAVPLSGTDPATVFDRVDLVVTAPAGDPVLVAPVDTPAGKFALGSARAGLRYHAGVVAPVIELDDVTVAGQHHDVVDITDVHALAATASADLLAAIKSGIAGVAPDRIANALLTLIGFGDGAAVTVDPVAFATGPTHALTAYFRALRASNTGWAPIVTALAELLGEAPAATAGGTGTRLDPWTVPLTTFAAPAGAIPSLSLVMWDSEPADAATARLTIGLDLAATHASPDWTVRVGIGLLTVELPATGAGVVRFLGHLDANVQLVPPPITAGPLTLSLTALTASTTWTPGDALQGEVTLGGLTVVDATTTSTLGDITLPTTGVDGPTLGLPCDAATVWSLLRTLLGPVAASWAGPGGSTLATLLGVGSPGALGLDADLPSLDLPDPGDLRSLLHSPLDAVRQWLGGLVANSAVDTDGNPWLPTLRGPLQAFLTDSVPILSPAAAPVGDPGSGRGSRDDPWTLPLNTGTGSPAELLFWLAPDGPPVPWAQAQLERIGFAPVPDDDTTDDTTTADEITDAPQLPPTIETLVDVIVALGLPALPADVLDDPALVAATLRVTAQSLQDTDGVVDRDAAQPDGPQWTNPEPVVAAHHLLPRHPDVVAAIGAQLTTLGTADAVVLLLAPALAGSDCWAPLLAARGITDEQSFGYSSAGSDPDHPDFGALSAASTYLLDFDDGSISLDDSVSRLQAITAAISALTPNAEMILVAHSYLGLTAAQYTALATAGVRGLITIGAPLTAVDVPGFDGDGDGLRIARAIAPDGLGATSALDDAMTFLIDGLDATAAAGAAVPQCPATAFARNSGDLPDIGTVPGLALAGTLDTDLVQALSDAVIRSGWSAAGPTHLGYGARVALIVPAPSGNEPVVDVWLGFDAGSVRLADDGATAPVPAFTVSVLISRPGGWLLDGTSAGPQLRWAKISVDVVAGFPTIAVTLTGVVAGGRSAASADLGDPLGRAGFDALVTLLQTNAATTPGGPSAAVIAVLAALDLLATDGSGADSDRIVALVIDPAGYLGPRLTSLLDATDGCFGIRPVAGAAPGDGPWSLDVDLGHSGQAPLQLLIEATPWRITLRTRTDGDGLHTAGAGRLSASWQIEPGTAATVAHGALALPWGSLSRDADSGQITLELAWVTDPVVLAPLDAAGLAPTLAPLLVRFLVDAVMTLATQNHLGGFPVRSLSGLALDPASWLLQSQVLGRAVASDESPSPTAINELLGTLAVLAGLPTSYPASDGQPLGLPGSLTVRAGAGTPAGTSLQLTGTDLAASGLRDISAGLVIDPTRHVTPAGQLTIRVPLPGEWHAVDLVLGVAADGVSFTVVVDPDGTPTTVALLPKVSGLDKLLAAVAGSLLSDALTAATQALAPSSGRTLALDVATGLGIYSDPAGFDPGQLAAFAGALTDPAAEFTPAVIVSAIRPALTTLLSGIVDVSTNEPSALTLTASLPGNSASVSVDVDFAPLTNTPYAPPTIGVGLSGLEFGATAGSDVELDVKLGAAWPQGVSAPVSLTAELTIGTNVDTGLGVTLPLALDLSLADGALSVDARLLPAGDADAALSVINLAPTPGIPHPEDFLAGLVTAWVAPLAAVLLVGVAENSPGSLLDKQLWTPAAGADAVTARSLLTDADILTTGTPARIRGLPQPAELLHALLDAVSTITIPLTDTLTVAVDADSDGGVGLVLAGHVDITAGDDTIRVALGPPSDPADIAKVFDALNWAPPGLHLTVLNVAQDASVTFAPGLVVSGVGVALSKTDATKNVVDSGLLVLHGAAAYVEASFQLTGTGGPRATSLRGAAMLDGLSLPFLSPTQGQDQDPVVTSLLAGRAGDQSTAGPPFDLVIGSAADGSNSTLLVSFDGAADSSQPQWLAVHRSFGPIYIDQVGLQHPANSNVIGVDLDAAVSLGPLGISLQNLSVRSAIPDLPRPADWVVGLDGLAVEFSAPDVVVEGALIRDGSGSTVQYLGTLQATVAGRGFAAIGAFSRPTDDSGDQYLSLFGFAAINVPLGGPPFFFVLGLSAGAGYNRQLIVPTDPLAVPSFPLVAAMLGPATGSTTDPIKALAPLRDAMPPRRGSYWLAAGVKFSSFEILQTTALAYVSLDRGVDVGVLGVTRMILPKQDSASASTPIVNAELAVNARFDSVARLFSVRAQLTDHSWLISKDCQLTGGFAFVVWFAERRFVFTIGGYAPQFQPGVDLPTVPRVGFNWSVGSAITVKGEAYLALLPSCFMTGGRLEVTYSTGSVSVWFTAWFDVFVDWDPFHFHTDIGISIGARFDLNVCVIFCVKIDVEVSIGASVTLDLPPLHGIATVNLDVASVTVEFGAKAPAAVPSLGWTDFTARYLPAPTGTPAAGGAVATAVHLVSGAAPGSSDGSPSAVVPTFALRTESRLPVFPVATLTAYASSTDATGSPVAVNPPDVTLPTHITLVPMGAQVAPITSVGHVIGIRPSAGAIVRAAGIHATGYVGGFATSLFVGGATDVQHADGAGASLAAIGGVDITFAPVIGSPAATLVFGGAGGNALDVRLSTALSFSSAATPSVKQPAVAAVPATVPTLLTRPLGRINHVQPGAPTRRQRQVEVVTDETTLPGDTTTVWEIDPRAQHAVRASQGSRLRLVCLSAAGYPLEDRILRDASVRLPVGTARIAATPFGGSAGDVRGWRSTTRLVQIGPNTALAPGAVVTADRVLPAVVRHRSALGVARAYRLLPRSTITTLFVGDVSSVIVFLDHAPGVDGEPPVVTVNGAIVEPLSSDPDEAGLRLWFDVARHLPRTEVRVASPARRLSGVVAARSATRLRRTNATRAGDLLVETPAPARMQLVATR